ncbi:hypothetical protein [Paenibacillus sp. FSL H3-0333]|uniref:hypothetical protein n=1 Tax=Paenibacillus sp. FSL H3-0333 TaxID=2921373 RepID=UPI0030FB5FEE
MEWKLFDMNNEYLIDVNCQYDSLDMSVMMYGATRVEINFDTKEAKILWLSDMIGEEEIKRRFLNIKTNNSSLYKPILLLYSLKKLKEGKRELDFIEVQKDLKKVYSRINNLKRVHVEYPFIYLINDGVWKINKEKVPTKLTSRELSEIKGGFNDEIIQVLKNKQNLIDELSSLIMETYFDEKIGQEFLKVI